MGTRWICESCGDKGFIAAHLGDYGFICKPCYLKLEKEKDVNQESQLRFNSKVHICQFCKSPLKGDFYSQGGHRYHIGCLDGTF